MTERNIAAFDPVAFLANAGLGRKIVQVKPNGTFFSQGNQANAIFYLQTGRAKLTVVSKEGKEATIALVSAGDFLGEESLASVGGRHMASATAISACTAMDVERSEMIRVMHEEHAFSDLFLKFLLTRSMRTQADLVDQLFNNSEKRLARILLLMPEFGKPGEPEPLIPKITQETLAEMVGTTRSRVSFFMNRFRKLGFMSHQHENAFQELHITCISPPDRTFVFPGSTGFSFEDLLSILLPVLERSERWEIHRLWDSSLVLTGLPHRQILPNRVKVAFSYRRAPTLHRTERERR